MAYRPQFKRCFRHAVVPDVGIFLMSERGQFVLRGAAYMHLAPFLDGRHTLEDLVAATDGRVSAPEVHYAVELLRRKGYVVDASVPVVPEHAAFWELSGIAPEVVARRLDETTVSVRAFGGVSAGPLEALLAEIGVRVTEGGERLVVLTDDYLRTGLDEVNREALAERRPWMLIKPIGVEPWIGPIFVPGRTGCWACLEHRLARHRKYEAFVQRRTGATGPLGLSIAALPSSVQTAVGAAATAVARWIVEEAGEDREGRVVALDTVSLERTEHALTRRPQCPVCGDPTLVAAGQRRPPDLVSRKAQSRNDGGYRVAPPEEMLARLERHVSPIVGIVSYLRSVMHRSGSALTPTYAADHNFANVDDELFFLNEFQRSNSGGKGKSDLQAKLGALAEAIERYSGVFQGDEARTRARMADLGPAAIHPNEIMLFSDAQLADRERWNHSGSRFTWVPQRFDPDLPIDWSPVFSLLDGRERHVPTACCYYAYGREHAAPFALGDSNGCAAGATREEAVFQGLLELVERDAVAIWWYNRLPRPGVDLASFGDPYLGALEDYYRTIHRSIWALDLTSDLGIPVFGAVSRRLDRRPEDIVFGFGAHLDPKIALLRAVTEANQLLPLVSGHTPDGPPTYRGDAIALRWWKTATLESEPYLRPDETVPRKGLDDHAQGCSEDLLVNVQRCVAALKEKDLDTFVLDQTRPDTGLSVVKVFVPGLRSFWARLAPGRLYDVPVRMGWLQRSLREEELNPTPFFF
ncbi:MAG: TOMM precursor leader peptide-binding protein [Polyangiaceae bacterium]|nr:TOMM precursor leader peptide-binding protein [Polyangiaceae bacterium]